MKERAASRRLDTCHLKVVVRSIKLATRNNLNSANLAWSSSINRAAGSGASVSTSALSVGTHTIRAAVADPGGLQDTASNQVTITIAGGTTLTTRRFKVKGKRNVELTWSPAGQGNVDVYRNGAVVITTPNDGNHIDVIPRQGQRNRGFLTLR